MTDKWSARFTLAEAALTRALSLAPKHVQAHATLGLVQVFTKRAVTLPIAHGEAASNRGNDGSANNGLVKVRRTRQARGLLCCPQC